MQTVQIRPGLTLEVTMMLTSDKHSELQPSEQIDRMFDRNKSETFDPTEAVEVDVGGTLRILEPGDRLSVIVQI